MANGEMEMKNRNADGLMKGSKVAQKKKKGCSFLYHASTFVLPNGDTAGNTVKRSNKKQDLWLFIMGS